MSRPYIDYIPDDALDRYYAKDYYGLGIGYFDDVAEGYDPDYPDDEEPWDKPSERATEW